MSIQASANRLSVARARARDCQQIVVAPGVEQRVLGERAGRHQPHHVAAHHALAAALLRLRGVFELLAHRDAVAERDQAMQIFVGALDRHAAHRDVAAEMLPAFGEHDAERARGDFGIGEEQLVEVAHPVEQQAVRIGGLDLDVLLHHGGDAGRRFGGGAGIDIGRGGARGIHDGGTLADGARAFTQARRPIHTFADLNSLQGSCAPVNCAVRLDNDLHGSIGRRHFLCDFELLDSITLCQPVQ